MLPLIATSTKAYFTASQTRSWVRLVSRLSEEARHLSVELAILPSFPMLDHAISTLAGTGITVGAQAVAEEDSGPQTGEVNASLLSELGARYVEIGHAERRARFGETREVVRRKCAVAAGAGLVPLLCVGELDSIPAKEAARFCVDQLEDATQDITECELVVAYEPVWAIGAAEPASPDHVRVVGSALQEVLRERAGTGRVIYGGTAGPGLASQLGTSVDGLFLGRRAHDPAALAAVMREVAAVHGLGLAAAAAGR